MPRSESVGGWFGLGGVGRCVDWFLGLWVGRPSVGRLVDQVVPVVVSNGPTFFSIANNILRLTYCIFTCLLFVFLLFK